MAPPQSSKWPVGRRIKAAMRLAGIDSFEELSERISERNYGSRTLRKYADDNDTEYVPTRGQLLVIAEACDLPYEFFTVDFGELGAEPERDELAGRVSSLEQALDAAERQRQHDLAAIAEELARQVSLALETGVLPTDEPGAATGKRAANG